MRIKTQDGIKKVIPDIVICNTKEVISIIELKYSPKGRPKFEKDIETLSLANSLGIKPSKLINVVETEMKS